MATITRSAFSKMCDGVASELRLHFSMRQQQIDVMYKTLVPKENVFAVLRTGFGKSECFGMLTRLMDKVN